ncbi:hypothetical protein ZTR_09022 [Talaromyces verruculosus]|nr:hypothetical protein ZTR_09022 [Talaromyces verruculosus]
MQAPNEPSNSVGRNGLMVLPSFSDYMKFSTATQAASTSIIWIGGVAIAPFGGPLLDRYGRKKGILGAFVISSVGVALQTSAQNAAMFMVGRLILGMGVGLGSITCPTYASEISPTKYRAFMLGFYYDLWYFGGMVTALITYGQLQINVALNVWCLACAGAGTLLADKIGRKPLAIGSLTFAPIFLYLVGTLTKRDYSFGWTTLLVVYPPEVLSFSLRANGMTIYTFVSNAAGVFATFIMPFALESIVWKPYMVNASWDVLEVVFVVLYWVETSKLSLEEIDEVLEVEVRLGAGNIIQAVDIEDAKTSCVPETVAKPQD